MASIQTPLTSQGFNSNAGSRTVSVAVSAGTNLCLALLFAAETKTVVVSSATYNSVGLTKLDAQAGASFGNAEIWYLVNPSTGTNNLVVNHTSDFHVVIGAIVGVNVNQAGPLRTAAKGTATTGTTNSKTVLSVGASDYVFGVLQLDGTGHTVLAGANETIQYDTISAAAANESACSTQAGSDGGVIAPTWTTSTHNILVASAFIDDGGGGGGTTVKQLAALGVG